VSVAPRADQALADEARGTGSRDGLSRAEARWARAPAVGLAGVLALGALNFLWQLGSSSYYVDELQSLDASLKPLGGFLHGLGTIEISPPAYFLFLHEWLYRLGSGSAWLRQLAAGHESLARLPSAVCGVLLVASVYWLTSLLSDRRATRVGAAALTALSPFVLQYAQLAQPYVFAALAATVAIGAAIAAERRPRARGRWLAVSLLACVLALCLHYTAALVVAPVCAWVAASARAPRGWRVGFPAGCLATGLALLPLALTQHRHFPGRPGTAHSGAVSLTSVANMIETPFTGRVDALRGLGVAVIVLAAVAAVRRGASARRRAVPVLAVGVPLCLLAVSAVGGASFLGHLMLPRYAAAAAPLMIVMVALAAESLPLPGAVALGACAAVVSLAGLLESHRSSGFYFDARDAVGYIEAHHRAHDAVLAPSDDVEALPLSGYGLDRLHPSRLGSGPNPLAEGRRVWVIGQLPQQNTPSSGELLRFERAALRSSAERPLSARVFPGVPPLAVVLFGPA
jgi:4-amino-4-deoxy-L-arabinose transferase-like glycosyltransferase